MPLFRKRRDAAARSYFFPDTFLAFLIEHIAAQTQETPEWRAMFSAWLVAGVTVADIMVGQIQELKSRWSGTQEEMVGVAKVFCLAMLSRWAAFVWAPEYSAADLQRGLDNAAKNILNLFEGLSDESLQEFLYVDSQFRAMVAHLRDPAHVGARLGEVEMLLSLAARELGRPLPAAISSLPMPPSGGEIELITAGWIPIPKTIEELLIAEGQLLACVPLMHDTYESLLKVSLPGR